jgi:hypothetical protein
VTVVSKSYQRKQGEGKSGGEGEKNRKKKLSEVNTRGVSRIDTFLTLIK